jgi:hypothetical protein
MTAEVKAQLKQTLKKLILRIEGLPELEGTWQELMFQAIDQPDRNWQIIEKLPFGERIITVHKSLKNFDTGGLLEA